MLQEAKKIFETDYNIKKMFLKKEEATISRERCGGREEEGNERRQDKAKKIYHT